MVEINVVKKRNKLWNIFNRDKIITLEKESFISNDSKIFTMGSCFAREIHNELNALGIDVYPKYKSVKFNRNQTMIGEGAGGRELVFLENFHTFSIRQEIERAHGMWEPLNSFLIQYIKLIKSSKKASLMQTFF